MSAIAPHTAAFRDLFLLDPDIAYLNHGAFGACPRPVFEQYQTLQRELERQPVDFLGIGRSFERRMGEARAALAAYLNAPADDIVFHDNSTTAINQVARSLRLAPGDEVLGNDHEYGAVERTWRFVTRQTDAVYVRAALPVPVSDPETLVEQLWARVTPRTRVLVVSHVTSVTALTFPVKTICARARAAGLVSVVDGAHAPAYLDLDLADIDADFYVGNCHKWLCAPKGSAFLYARRDVQPLLSPLVVSWGWETEHPGPSRFIDENEFQATRDISPRLTVPAAIAFQRTHDWDQVRASCRALCDEAAARVTALTGLSPIAPAATSWTGQMRTLALPECDVEEVKRRLYDEHGVEVPVFRWNDRPWLRISVQGYNTGRDVDRLLEGLARVL